MLAWKIATQLARGVRHRRHIDRGVRILTYHGVVEQRTDPRVEASFHLLADFRAHVALLRRCHVVPLAELADELARPHGVGPTRARPRVAITFDDGFRNNLLAADVLHAARLPATIFVASDNVARGEPIWPTLVRLVLARGSARTPRLGDATFELDRDPHAFGAARAAFKDLAADARVALWRELVAQLRRGELDELIADVPSIAMMSWRDISSLGAAGIAFGSHGLRHELQHAAQPVATRIAELVDSRAQIEAALGAPCPHFAFPNGSFVATSPAELRAAGYALGFTMVSRAATADDDRALLPRIVPGAAPEKLVSSLVFGN